MSEFKMSKKAPRERDMWGKPIYRLKRSIMNTKSYKAQRDYALARAGYKCEKCGKAIGEVGLDGKIIKQFDMHHLDDNSCQMLIEKYGITSGKEAENYPELFDINAVSILCCCCHKKTDSYSLHSSTQKKKFKTND